MPAIATLNVQLTATSTEFTKGLRQANRPLSDFRKGVNAATSAANGMSMKMTANMTRVRGSITGMVSELRGLAMSLAGVGAGLSLASGLKAAIDAGANFEQEMARAKALSGATASEFAALSQEAKMLGSTTAFSATQAAEAISEFSMAGFQVKETLDALGPTLNLALAGQVSIGQAAGITAGILRSFGLEASKTGQVADVLTVGFTKAATNLNELGDAFKYVGPVARASGKGLTETTAALQALANQSIRGGQAGTSLRQVLIRLQKVASGISDTDTGPVAVQAARDLGIELLDMEGNLKSLPDLVDEFNRKLAGMNDTARTSELIKIFPAEAVASFTALLSTGGDELRRYQTRLESSGGAAEKIAAIQGNTLRGAFIRLGSAMEGFGIAVFEQMEGSLRPAVEGLANAFSYLTNELPRFIEEHGRLLQTLALGGAAFTAAIVILPQVGAGITAVSAAVAGLNATMAITKVATLGVAAASAALNATLIGAVAAGIAVVTVAFIRAKAEGTSFGEQILRIADDLGVWTDHAGRLKQAQIELGKANKRVTDAHRLLDASNTDADRLAAQLELVQAMESRVDAMKKARDAQDRFNQSQGQQTIAAQSRLDTAKVKQFSDDLNVAKTALANMQTKAQQVNTPVRQLADGMADAADAAANMQVQLSNAKHVTDTIVQLQKQVAQFGMSDNAKQVADLVDMKATDDQIAKVKELHVQLAQLQTGDTVTQLRIEVQNFGLDDATRKLNELHDAGASKEQLAEYAALQARLTQLNETQKTHQQLMDKGKQLFESTRTPMEQYESTVGQLSDLLNAGAIDWDTYGRAIRQARSELENINQTDKPNTLALGNAATDQFLYETRRQAQLARAELSITPTVSPTVVASSPVSPTVPQIPDLGNVSQSQNTLNDITSTVGTGTTAWQQYASAISDTRKQLDAIAVASLPAIPDNLSVKSTSSVKERVSVDQPAGFAKMGVIFRKQLLEQQTTNRHLEALRKSTDRQAGINITSF